MERSTFTVELAHSASANIGLLQENIRVALLSGLRNVQSVDVGVPVVVTPIVHFYLLTLSNNVDVFKMPITSRIEGASIDSITADLEHRNSIPQGFVITEIESIDRHTFENMDLDPLDPRYEDSFERVSSPLYYKVVLTDGQFNIMSSKILYDQTGFKRHAVSLGKANSVDEILRIDSISKDDYYCIKFGATRKLPTWLKYNITYLLDGVESVVRFSTKFEFPSLELVFEQAIRKEKVPMGATLHSIVPVEDVVEEVQEVRGDDDMQCDEAI